MTFLVTGGSGFIGSGIVKALLVAGHKVRSFHLPGDYLRLLEGLPVEPVAGDICDLGLLIEAAKGCEGVFHTAGNMSFLRRDRPLLYRVNVEGSRTVTEACLRAQVRRLVHTSTVNACGIPDPRGALGDEETPFNWGKLGFHYALSKRRGEKIALAANGSRLEVVVVNPGTVFGAGDLHSHAGGYIRAAQKWPVLFYPGGGANCVHVKAVVEGHLAAFFKGRPGQRYILGGENLTYREIFATIADVLKLPRLLVPIPLPAALACARPLGLLARAAGIPNALSAEAVRAGYLKLYYSSAKAERELGLRRVPFREAVEEAAAWYAQTGRIDSVPPIRSFNS
jgi:dihydroflavonol-4-reductase